MSWKPPKGTEREVAAEYWKPREDGDTVIGQIDEYGETRFGGYIQLAPVVHYTSDGKKMYGSARVGLNAWLSKVLGPRRVKAGSVVAIKFTGMQETPEGAMRTFEVYRLSDADWREEAGDLSESGDELPF